MLQIQPLACHALCRDCHKTDWLMLMVETLVMHLQYSVWLGCVCSFLLDLVLAWCSLEALSWGEDVGVTGHMGYGVHGWMVHRWVLMFAVTEYLRLLVGSRWTSVLGLDGTMIVFPWVPAEGRATKMFAWAAGVVGL